jgi:hypothetical protein
MTITLQVNLNDSNLLATEKAAFVSGFYGLPTGFTGWLTMSQGNYDIEATGLDAAPDYNSHTEGAGITTQRAQKGYRETATKEAYSLGIAFSEEVWAELAPEVKADFMASMGVSGARRMLQSMFDILNNSVTTTRGDGVATISGSHPSRVGNQSNSGSSAPDFAGITAAHLALVQTRGPDGQKLNLTPRMLIGGASLRDEFFQALEATHQAADDRSDPNYVGTLGLVPYTSDYIDSATRWWLLAEEAPRNIRFHVQRLSMPYMEEVPLSGGDQAMLDKVRWRHLIREWRGIYSSST